jgi:succinate dehydrogenase/fumarate reductase flavoprotein subunit
MDWFELRAALLAAEAVAVAALGRTESRGAHQREDAPETSPELEQNQTVTLRDGELVTGWTGVVRRDYELAEKTAAP